MESKSRQSQISLPANQLWQHTEGASAK